MLAERLVQIDFVLLELLSGLLGLQFKAALWSMSQYFVLLHVGVKKLLTFLIPRQAAMMVIKMT